MIFTSFIYPVFLVFAAVIYYVFPARHAWVWLLVASAAYYVSFIPVFFFLLIAVILINYLMGQWQAKVPENRNKHVLVLIVIVNLLILAFFKYFNNIFPENQVHLYNVDLFFRTDPINKLILPLGISYIIFTVLSYQIEVKRKNIEPEKHLGYFSLYLLFFPRIAQGPIERPRNLISQIRLPRNFDPDLAADGLKQILWGYFKKLVVADRIAIYVNAVYDNNEYHSGASLLIATIFFAFQIYADFSGYTDIALGSAKLFGIKLTDNFRQPYLATSIKDFWDRWHITFSLWLRDYLYSPLAYYLSHRLKKEKYLSIPSDRIVYAISIMITFAVCGIWHGVGWTYLVWGLMFGVFLTYSNWTRNYNKKIRKRFGILKTSGYYISYKIIITFILVLFAWVFFRADSLNEAASIIFKILLPRGPVFRGIPTDTVFALLGVLAMIALDIRREFFPGKFMLIYNRHPAIRLAGIAVILMIILLAGVFDGGQFIYFQF